jgi:hypothetical protein
VARVRRALGGCPYDPETDVFATALPDAVDRVRATVVAPGLRRWLARLGRQV